MNIHSKREPRNTAAPDREKTVRNVTRRHAVKQVIAFAAVGFGGISLMRFARAQPVEEIHQLKPGEFVWHPEREPDGPVSIIVSIPDQLVHVYRNGVRIAVSTCSTGRPGHLTPTGVFTILQKDKDHHSSVYDDAPMPNMNRITWSGVALHAGNLPGYPASHGCIRLPMKFSDLLFGVTHVGTPVIVAGAASAPFDIAHPGLALTGDAVQELDAAQVTAVTLKKNPWQADVDDFSKPVSIVISRADLSAIVFQGGDIIAQDTITLRNPDQPLGSNVFVLTGIDGKGMSWKAISHQASADQAVVQADTSVIQRISAGKAVLDAMQERMHPGLVLVTTDLPAHADTRSGKDFVIMSQDLS
jgi:hypothetical protein